MIFKIRQQTLGSHVHFDIFCALRSNMTFANCGHVVLDEGVQARSFAEVLRRGSGDGGHVIFEEPPLKKPV